MAHTETQALDTISDELITASRQRIDAALAPAFESVRHLLGDDASPAEKAAAIGEALDKNDPEWLRAIALAIEECSTRIRRDGRVVVMAWMGEAQRRAVVRALRHLAAAKGAAQ